MVINTTTFQSVEPEMLLHGLFRVNQTLSLRIAYIIARNVLRRSQEVRELMRVGSAGTVSPPTDEPRAK